MKELLKTLQLFDIVEIRWTDAASLDTSSKVWFEEKEFPHPKLVQSVGMVVQIFENYVVLALNYSGHFSELFAIPTNCIVGAKWLGRLDASVEGFDARGGLIGIPLLQENRC